MATLLERAVGTYQRLKRTWNGGTGDIDACGALLARLKVMLLELSFLPESADELTLKEALLARDVLELGVQWSIRADDVTAFQRYVAQLKTYYFDYDAIPDLPAASYKYPILGLNLLFLLSENKIAEFHTELERIDARAVQESVYIRHPVQLEQYLMEGAYNKVFLARDSVPDTLYAYFIDRVVDTLRDEIAGCCEAAYATLPIGEAQKLLFFDTVGEAAAFAGDRGWAVADGVATFPRQDAAAATGIPAMDVIEQTLNYARELEKIV